MESSLAYLPPVMLGLVGSLLAGLMTGAGAVPLLLERRSTDGRRPFWGIPAKPFRANRDAHAWSVAKRGVGGGEDLLAAAHREFRNETGLALTDAVMPLAQPRQPGGRIVHTWAIAVEIDPATIRSDLSPLEWPPGSGRLGNLAEVDRADWLGLPEARSLIVKGQFGLLDELESVLGSWPRPELRRRPPSRVGTGSGLT